jgi:multiple antibiotic resistance protein
MLTELISEFVTLWVVIDPIGTVPIFLAITKNMSPAERNRAALRGILFAAGVLVAFIVGGQIMLRAMGIELYAFQIAGGIVLFLFSLMMVFDKIHVPTEIEPGHDAAVYPLAVPSIAGPGAILAVVVLTDNDRFSMIEQTYTTIEMLVVLFILFIMLLGAGQIQRVIGKTGINIVTRVMGLVLSAVAVQMVLTGLSKYFDH